MKIFYAFLSAIFETIWQMLDNFPATSFAGVIAGPLLMALVVAPAFWVIWLLDLLFSHSFIGDILMNDFFAGNQIISIIVWFAIVILANFGILLCLKRIARWILRKRKSRSYSQNPARWHKIWKIVLVIFWVWMTLIVLFWGAVFWHEADGPRMHDYAVLNSAIKNTCFIDPAKENCPRVLEEISYIEPAQFEQKMINEKVQSNYVYDPESGFYTWVIRYQPERALIFDWRFTHQGGPDFKESVPVDIWQNRIAKEDAGEWIDDAVLQFPEWEWF